MVDHPVYYLGNLIIAKYLELTHGFKIWALISSEQDSKAVLTAKSFGVDGITYVRDEAAKEASPVAAAVIRHLENTSDVELRKRLLAIQINGLPVGDLIYDTYVRETRRITIRAFDDDLKAYLILLVNYCTLYERLLGALDVGAVVLVDDIGALSQQHGLVLVLVGLSFLRRLHGVSCDLGHLLHVAPLRFVVDSVGLVGVHERQSR